MNEMRDMMKERLKVLMTCLAQRHYSINIIQRAILLPTQVENTAEVLEEVIQAVQTTQTELQLQEAIVKIEKKYLKD